MEEYVSFDAFDDCYITIDDFAYLNHFQRRIVLSAKLYFRRAV